MLSSAIFIKSNLKCHFFILLLHIGRSNHTLCYQSLSSKQNTSASVPKSPPPVQFIFSSHSTEAIVPNKAYLWSRSKCWMRAHKRTFNTQRPKSQICLIRDNGFVCSLLNELNSNSKCQVKRKNLYFLSRISNVFL